MLSATRRLGAAGASRGAARWISKEAASASSRGGGLAVGIDLGTTNSCVAVFENGQTTVIPNAEGARTTPSVVTLEPAAPVVGVAAKRQAATHHDKTFFATKRLIGRKFAEVSGEVSGLPYGVVAAKNGDAWLSAGDGRQLSPSQVGAMILQKMKETAEAYTGTPVRDAVITVPAYFDDTQRQATKDAGKIAGLNVLRIINEPTAAALAYGLDKVDKPARTIAVYDLGGGTFDISILELNGSVFEVKATNGDSSLGGEDVDSALTDHLLNVFAESSGLNDLKEDKVVLQRIREAAETLKQELSSKQQSEVNIPFLAIDPETKAVHHLRTTLTRAQLNEIANPILERTVDPCRKCLLDSGVRKEDIDEVILVGGMTRMPRVHEIVEHVFGKKPNASVNPDEAVAIGAAIQAGILSGHKDDLLLLDVTPLSLGIETMGGVFTRLIDRNTSIPTKKSSLFSTAVDNQDRVSIKVYQGERLMASHNKQLGQFELTGIPPAPRGVPQIEVTFDIDADGMLNVSAKDRATGQQQEVAIKSSGGLSSEEIEQMIKDAESNLSEDKDSMDFATAKNDAESLVYKAEVVMREQHAAMSTRESNSLEDAVRSVRGAQTGAEIRSAMGVLTDILQTLAKKSAP